MGSTNTSVTLVLVQYPWYLIFRTNGCHQKGKQKRGDLGESKGQATVTTDPEKGIAKLEQQIAKLMAVLTQSRQGSSPSSAPGSP